MKRWHITSPSYVVVEPVLEDGSGPEYDTVSFAEVEANTKSQAKGFAVKAWRNAVWKQQIPQVRDWSGGLEYCDGGLLNPFKGLKVEEVHPCTKHGYDFEDCVSGECIPYWCDVCGQPIEPLGSEVIIDQAPEEAGGNSYSHYLCTLTEEEHARAIYGSDYQ